MLPGAEAERLIIEVELALTDDAGTKVPDWRTRYTFHGDGRIDIDNAFEPKDG